MLTFRLIRIASLLSFIAAGCSSGGSGSHPDAGPDGGNTPEVDGGSKPADGGHKADGGKPADGGTSACGSVAICKSPATCDRGGATPTCVCPKGYKFNAATAATDPCVDIDECASATLNACDSNATCTNKPGTFECACNAPAYKGDGKTCTCATGYTEVSGECKADDGTACAKGADCQNGNCVGKICCASACDAPSTCKTSEGATCADGSTCVYPTAADGTACDDGDACTMTDLCANASCVGSGTVSCDDSNICTADSCVSPTGCVHDGTGITTADCMPGDACMSFHCDGDAAGTCDAMPLLDCSAMADQCNAGVCDPTPVGGPACAKVPSREGMTCEDGNACTGGETCGSGTCSGGTALNLDDGNPCTDDTCDTSLGPKHQNNTAACDDSNPCTLNDVCSAGQCSGSPKPCAGDACNDGSCNPSNGNCGLTPKSGSPSCNDGDSCTATDTCQNGTCTGSGNACGAHSSACSQGSPNSCTCDATYVSSGGACVPNLNECAAGNQCSTALCDANATCNDPSSGCGDRTCTCKPGYSGNGLTCTNIDECVGNPCGAGRGTCAENAPGAGYACSCNAGNVSVDATDDGQANPTCVCDMNGTFAQQFTVAVSWSGIGFVENATNTTSKSWAIRTQSYDASGNLVIHTMPCGGTTPDVCGQGNPFTPAPDEAYAQFLSTQIFGTPTMPVGTLTMSLPNALQGQPYVEPQTAVLFGISLTDPLGTWPAAIANIGAGSSQTNGALWVDHDNDGQTGVTSFSVPPGGILQAMSPNPAIDYAATSSACPRLSSGTRLPYDYWPGIDTGFVFRQVKRFYTAERVVSSMNGAITTCDGTGAALISGSIGGPDNGQMQTDLRFGGCVRVNGGGELDCGSTLTDFYDGQSQTQHVTSGSFIIKRWANGTAVTCANARAAFP